MSATVCHRKFPQLLWGDDALLLIVVDAVFAVVPIFPAMLSIIVLVFLMFQHVAILAQDLARTQRCVFVSTGSLAAMLRAVTLALASQVVLGQSVTNVYSIDIDEPLYPEGISFSRTSDRVTLTSCVTGMFVQLAASLDMSLIQLYKYETNHT